jgi:hypothetical protein
VIESNRLHKNKYDYSESEFTDVSTRIKIKCPIHGIFIQLPYNHLAGKGCAECKRVKMLSGIERFILKSIGVHGEKYDYSKVEYKNNCTSVILTCKLHGEFKQEPRMHISGRGCPTCGRSRTSSQELSFLDQVGIPKEDRQIIIDGTRLQVDGIDRKTGTIYEYLGDYWHGNPKVYSSDVKILDGNVTCGEAYKNTFKRFDRLSSIGYKIKYIWETDWKNWIKSKERSIPIQDY